TKLGVQLAGQGPQPCRHRTGPPEREQAELPADTDTGNAAQRLAHGRRSLLAAEKRRQHNAEPSRHHLLGEGDDRRRDTGNLVDHNHARPTALAVRRMRDPAGRMTAGSPGIEQAHGIEGYAAEHPTTGPRPRLQLPTGPNSQAQLSWAGPMSANSVC